MEEQGVADSFDGFCEELWVVGSVLETAPNLLSRLTDTVVVSPVISASASIVVEGRA